MNRISLRIFLGVWLTLLVVIGSTIGLALVLVARASPAGEPEPFIADAAQALAHGGREGLRQWLAGPGQELPYFLVYVLDESGRDLLGRTPVGPLRSWPSGKTVTLPTTPGVSYAPGRPMPTIAGPDGVRYSIVTLPPAWSPFRGLARTGNLAAALASACGLTALISWVLAASLTRPIRELTRHTESIGRGDLDREIPAQTLERGDEIGDLGRSFSTMTARLRELLEAHEQLLRDVSHELRSPVARMKMALALARQPAGDVATQLTRLEGEAQRMDDMVGQILALTRLHSAAGALALARVDLAELVDGIAADAGFEAESTGRSIHWASSTPSVFVLANEHWLGSAIENVVRNAIRYGAPGQPVEIELDATTEVLSLQIRDYGAGVPSDELSRIFTPFYRTTAAREGAISGEGLGLAITYRIMRLHGGTARARNAAEGSGLIVELTLPALRQAQRRS